VGAQFPLTPALSPKERGEPGPVLEHARTAGFVDRRTAIHPLLGESAGVGGNGTLLAASRVGSPYGQSLSSGTVVFFISQM